MTDEYQALLQSVLIRRIPPREGMRRLRQWATTDFDSNPAYVNYTQAAPSEVELDPAAVREALEAFLRDDTPAAEMRDWALFIALSGFCSPQTPPEDDDWFDPLWDAIHEMACPEVHGPITRANLARYLDSFDRFHAGGP